VIKPQPERGRWTNGVWSGWASYCRSDKTSWSYATDKDSAKKLLMDAPYKPDDILWVRETWCELYDLDDNDGVILGTNKYYYAADGDNPTPYNAFLNPRTGELDTCREYPFWKPSIHMPKEAARLFLCVTDVRVERLQTISETDAKAEGVSEGVTIINNGKDAIVSYINPFILLWNSINGKRGYGWEQNPWVWVISFKKVVKPEGVE
jgi:hypothetical protein